MIKSLIFTWFAIYISIPSIEGLSDCFTTELEQAPLEVNVRLILDNIADVDEVRKTISLDVSISIRWSEEQFKPLLQDNKTDKPVLLVSEEEAKKKLCMTGLDILNEKSESPKRNQKVIILFNVNHQRANVRKDMKVTIYCPWNLSQFPFDRHDCNFTYGLIYLSHDKAYIINERIVFKDKYHYFGQDPISIDLEGLPFDITLQSQSNFTVPRLDYQEKANNFSYTGVTFHFKRNSLGMLFGSFYLPTFIFTSLSMLSFAIKPDAVPGRLGMLLTLYLIAINTYNSVDAPPDRHFSYIEVWLIGIHVPFLIAILEYGVLLVVMNNLKTKDDYRKICRIMDRVTCLTVLLFIVVFNLTYWMALL